MDQEVSTFSRSGIRQTLLVNVCVLHDDNGRVIGAVETFRVVRVEEEACNAGARDPQLTGMIARSRAVLSILERLPDVAVSHANVLISGESGSGKELLARAIHRLSPRRNQPLVAVNCSALAESLLESELFGHEKGAFTSADSAKTGRFEMAGGGTLFLDEIGEMKPELQVKLPRVIEQREFERVGGTRSIPLEARITSATNQDLHLAMAQGSFRDDLYYRLRTVPLSLPPLRDRLEDIPLLDRPFPQGVQPALREGRPLRGPQGGRVGFAILSFIINRFIEWHSRCLAMVETLATHLGKPTFKEICMNHGHAMDDIMDRYPARPEYLIFMLQDIQSSYGYISPEFMEQACDRAGVPLTQSYAVATFYLLFRLVPSGEHEIRVCQGTACH